jgi:hypothetical protein
VTHFVTSRRLDPSCHRMSVALLGDLHLGPASASASVRRVRPTLAERDTNSRRASLINRCGRKPGNNRQESASFALIRNTSLLFCDTYGQASPERGVTGLLGQPVMTNNVIFRGAAGELSCQFAPAKRAVPCKLQLRRGLRYCAAIVTSSGGHGIGLAMYWAVPRQGYTRV